MELSSKVLSDVVIHTKYAKYLTKEKRRENWDELVSRSVAMHSAKFPALKEEIEAAFQLVRERKVLPSMRALQFAGKPIEISPARIYNCSLVAIDSPDAFSEAMFLLLSGSGVGYSVQYHHVECLPPVRGPLRAKKDDGRKRRYLVGDSIEGWADAVKMLVESYFLGKKEIEFDFRDIRAKGAHLVTSGGKAPGPQPLKDCLHNIEKVLDLALEERGANARLKPIEAHDIMCHIADAVLAGGIRRAAMISFFDLNDADMLTAKYGNWWEMNPQRGRANNSAVIVRQKITREVFDELWVRVRDSGSGEPGIIFTNDKNILGNPCMEVAMHVNQFCNLTTLNAGDVESQEDFNARCKAAALIGTLQASYTDFHYLRDIWRKTTEKEALLGVSITGVASNGFMAKIDLASGARIVLKENERVAKLIGINKAARTTLLKPEGSSSLVVGSSSGVHPWHSEYYIRRVRVGKAEPLYKYFSAVNPSMLEDDVLLKDTAILRFPIKAPEGSATRTESSLEMLERIKKLNVDWITPGHRKGVNKHNVSATLSVRENEWDLVRDWMWENREFYNGLAVLPFDGGSYVQMPYEECTKEEYEAALAAINPIDLTEIIEDQDSTDLKGELACSGGSCTITRL